jgi:molybdate transport system substrate-binding protein
LKTFALTLCLALASAATAQRSIQIAAAADLAPVLPPILDEFKAKTGITAQASFASSATLATQIANGGPFDLFLSADIGFAQRVIDQGLGTSAKPVPYAQGTLVLWERNDGPVHPITIDALTSASVKGLAIANPEHAPYGRATMASLTSLHLADAVQPKLRVAENIAQAAQFVESGNAELGLISLTSAKTQTLSSEGSYIEMPASSYPPILQGAVVLKGKNEGKNAQDAQAFLDFLLSKPVEEELAARGLKAPR